MQNYLAVLIISNNSVHERYGTNLLTCEYLVWTDTYSAHVVTVSAGQNRRRSTGHNPMALRVRNDWPEKCTIRYRTLCIFIMLLIFLLRLDLLPRLRDCRWRLQSLMPLYLESRHPVYPTHLKTPHGNSMEIIKIWRIVWTGYNIATLKMIVVCQ